MDRTFRTVITVYTLIGVALLAVVIVSLRSQRSALRSAEWIDHTRATLTELDALLSSLQHAEGAVRSFLFTLAESDRLAYRDSFNDLGEKVEITRAFVRSYPDQLVVFEELETLLVSRVDFARNLLAMRQSGDEEELKRLLEGDETNTDMFEIRRLAQQIRNHFTAELAVHDRDVYEQDRHTRTLLLAVAALTLVTLVGSAWFIRDDLRHRRQLAQAAEQTRVELEALVQERTHELQTANHQLRTDTLELRWRGEALDHQLRYSQCIINAVSDLVFVVTKLGRISRINPAVARLTGFDASELVQRLLTDVALLPDPPPSETTDKANPLMRAIKLGDELRDLRVNVTTKQSAPLSATLRLSPLHDRDQVIGAVATLRIDA